MKTIESAGCVIVDFSGAEPTALCLVNEWGLWDFPKGQMEEGESKFDTALRETAEECGLTPEDFHASNVSAATAPYGTGGGKKIATYFFAEKTSDAKPFLPVNPELGKPEHVGWRWFPVSQLHTLMSRRLLPIIDALVSWCDNPPVDQG